ncbi:MAG: hypothetical protein LW704_06930 [Cryomorphaceae bacterium]|nr:hypothetical protein [Cryomorphaceae bacterium]
MAQETVTLILGEQRTIYSKFLNETRTINIYLPEDYHENDTTQYPVIYILDGGMEEDFIHLVGLVRFNTQPWIARFPRSIVVGIENTKRRRDFTFEVGSLDFLEDGETNHYWKLQNTARSTQLPFISVLVSKRKSQECTLTPRNWQTFSKKRVHHLAGYILIICQTSFIPRYFIRPFTMRIKCFIR